MTRLVFHAKPEMIPSRLRAGDFHVALYESSPTRRGTFAIGGQIYDVCSRLKVLLEPVAFDFLTIALAVTAADTFVSRDQAEDGWARTFEIELPLHQSKPWTAILPKLEHYLGYLSGDQWHFNFYDKGRPPPGPKLVRSRRRTVNITKADCVSLFSGGLDSAIGAVDLIDDGKKPLLVSHAYRGDQMHQKQIAPMLSRQCPRFSLLANPISGSEDANDVSMRTRSFNFLAFGAVAASAISQLRKRTVDFYVPENGFIGLNAPLSARRIGSHSTRTTHPYFLAGIQDIFTEAGLKARIVAPYDQMTKGEMMAPHAGDPLFEAIANASVSCGKWKRRNQQCGSCVPCIIRRAAFHASGIDDKTSYIHDDLHAVLGDEDGRDDLMALMTAAKRLSSANVATWVIKAGALPEDKTVRTGYVDVFRRGLSEVTTFLASRGIT